MDLLVQGGNRQEILRFRLGSDPQSRLDERLEKNRNGTSTPEEASKLETFEHFEHVASWTLTFRGSHVRFQVRQGVIILESVVQSSPQSSMVFFVII